ncbi:MAG: hypothetical protein ACON4E_07505 [Flavobacteriales bacterium]
MMIGCSGIEVENLIGDYYLTKIDYVDSELDLSYKLNESGSFIGVIPPKIIEVGYNESFIIAKNQSNKNGEISYYIVPLRNKVHKSPDENKIGPLTIDEFKLKRKALGVPDELVFTKK